jgi:hypothetical protein
MTVYVGALSTALVKGIGEIDVPAGVLAVGIRSNIINTICMLGHIGNTDASDNNGTETSSYESSGYWILAH